MTDIMTEGIADYMSREVVNALAPAYPSIGENKAEAEKYLYDAMMYSPNSVTGALKITHFRSWAAFGRRLNTRIKMQTPAVS